MRQDGTVKTRAPDWLRATFVLALPPAWLRSTFVLTMPPAWLRSNVPNVRSNEGVGGGTERSVAILARAQVKWVQSVVPSFIKDRLRERVGDNWFEQVVSKEIQKSCQSRRIDDDTDEKLPVEEYLDWIQFINLAKVKEIREDVKDALSIRLPDEQGGKHFYAGWFDAINRIRRIAAHPSGRAYKQADIETLSIVVDHLESYLPKTYSESGPDAAIS